MKILLDYKFSRAALAKMPEHERKEQRALYYLLRLRQVGRTPKGALMILVGGNAYGLRFTNKGLLSKIFWYGTKEEARAAGLLFPNIF